MDLLGSILALASATLLAVPGGVPAGQQDGITITPVRSGLPPRFFDEQLDQARRLGVGLVRTEVTWAALEPARGRLDRRYLALADRMVSAAHRRGLRVLVTFTGTPCWTSVVPGRRRLCATAAGRARAEGFAPADPGAYARTAALLARRWATRVAAIEIYNEPDLAGAGTFAGPGRSRRYAALLRAAYPAVKRAAPGVAVLGGSLVGMDGRFLERLYAHGARGRYDALAIHPYNDTVAAVRGLRAVQVRHGDDKPLWLTEFGATSCLARATSEFGHACVTPREQARQVVDAVCGVRPLPYVRAAVLYNLRDGNAFDFGVLDRAARPKPVYRALRAVLTPRRSPRAARTTPASACRRGA